MVNISKALNAGKVHDYHKQDYANSSQKAYFSEGDQVTGQWHGKLAGEMGLAGPISSDHFHRLAEGQDPHTGDQLVRHRIATERSVDHRAGWDATFSAPKSVSLTALVGGDERIVEAHRAAVTTALDYLERYSHARIGGNNPPEHTGKWAAATFEHDTSRPVDGYSAPQLHTHAIFFNVAKSQDENFHAVDARHIFAAQKTATAIYQAELGYRLRQLGYELEDGKGGAREIKGYTPEYLKANSSRSEQIEQLAKELEAKGIKRAEARQMAAHSTRQAKSHQSPEQTREKQQDLAARHGHQHQSIIAAARAAELTNRQAFTETRAQKTASEALTFSRDKNFEREAVVSEHDLLREALRRGQDLTSAAHIDSALKTRQAQGEFLPLKTAQAQPAYTTPEIVALERQNITLMKAGQHECRPLVAQNHIPQAATERLTDSQRDAATQILTSRDRVQALQGAAGTGKTFTLTVIREQLEKNGYDVRGMAPTSRATQQLAECGAQCSTLQMHLTKPHQTTDRPTVYFIDETSLASTKQVNQFLSSMGANDRVVLIGDTRQHESVEAGRAFAQLQDHGISTARLDEIVRQKDESLKTTVEHLAAGQVNEAVAKLQRDGRVTELPNPEQRYRRISAEYRKDRDGTLVVSPDNHSRAEINAVIHNDLKRSGEIAEHDHTVPVLVTRQDVTGAERKWAQTYEVGNTLRFSKANATVGVNAGEYVKVHAINAKDNTLTVETAAGKTVTYDPSRAYGVTVYRPEERQFAVGDRVQFTAPSKQHEVANRELGRITSINERTLNVSLDSGRNITLDKTASRHLDYGYAVTSHSSQGLTANRVLVNIDSDRTNNQLLNTRLAYVAISRARHDAQIYTNDAATLSQVLGRDVSKTSAVGLDVTPTPSLTPRQTPNAHTPPSKEQAQQPSRSQKSGQHLSKPPAPALVPKEKQIAEELGEGLGL